MNTDLETKAKVAETISRQAARVSAAEATEAAKDRAEGVAGDVRDKAGEVLGNIKDKAGDVMDNLNEKYHLDEKGAELKAGAANALHKGADLLDKLADKLG